MKMLLASAALLLSVSAYASVKPFGGFVAQSCSLPATNTGFSTDILAVDKACLGELAGLNQVAVRLYLNDGSEQTFGIEVEQKFQGLGLTNQAFIGEDINPLTSNAHKIEGVLTTINGIRRSQSIKLRTSGNLKFQGNIEAVYNTL